MLTHHFAKDDLAEARTAVADRIVAEFKSTKRLVPDSLVEELKSLRSLANKVVMGVGKYLSHEDLVAAFTLRSKRLVTQEILSSHIDGALPDEKVERLLFVEENVIGAENKRQLAAFILPVVNSAPSRIISPIAKIADAAAVCSGWPSCRAGAPLQFRRGTAPGDRRQDWTGSRWPPPPRQTVRDHGRPRPSHVEKAQHAC